MNVMVLGLLAHWKVICWKINGFNDFRSKPAATNDVAGGGIQRVDLELICSSKNITPTI